MNYKKISILLLAGLLLLFILQNVAVIEVQFLFWSIQMSRTLLVVFLLFIGAICGWFSHSYYLFHKHRLKQKKNI